MYKVGSTGKNGAPFRGRVESFLVRKDPMDKFGLLAVLRCADWVGLSLRLGLR